MTEIIDEGAITRANQLLRKYRAGKAALEARIVEAEQWWKLRHNEIPRDGRTDPRENVSAWLFNTIAGKHADAMDAYPQPNFLPREASDRETARLLGAVVPCILEQCGFEEVWSDVMWQKLKQGTGVYKILWDPAKLHGLGDVAVTRADVLSLFWEPGLTDIQKSPNLFHVEMWDREKLRNAWPDAGAVHGGVTVSRYLNEDGADTADRVPVVDWYYKKGGKLHYCKYAGSQVLYATENDPKLCERGWYDHGMYPFVFDRLYPVEGSPCGFGYVDVGKHAQDSIDRLGSAVTRNALMAAEPRYFIRGDGAVNEEEFADWTAPLVHVSGNLGADSVRQITVSPVADVCVAVLNNKIEELKFTAGNQDVQNGQNPSGVTAASAIAALQETAGRMSRDSTRGAYRAFSRVVEQVVELVRQFYEMPRAFRITGEAGREAFISFSNAAMVPKAQGVDFGVDMGWRTPGFDVKAAPAKKTAYTSMGQNETALQLYKLGFFQPRNALQALSCLEMMDFDGKDAVIRRIRQNAAVLQDTAEKVPEMQGKGEVNMPGEISNITGRAAPRESAAVRKSRQRAAQASQV